MQNDPARRAFLGGAVALASLGAVGLIAARRFDLRARLFNPLTIEKFALDPVPGLARPGISSADFASRPAMVVLFASWCPPCREEHGRIGDLARRANLPVYGALYRDNPQAARDFLREKGDPFVAIGDDPRGFFARAAGARGVPATLVLAPGPRLILRIDGTLSEQDVDERIKPALRA
ncbi:MAG: redoxin family protein [Hyphomicrobiales bacterium]|nr:redoxin family protein [Hyphomicrobiales bacterium]